MLQDTAVDYVKATVYGNCTLSAVRHVARGEEGLPHVIEVREGHTRECLSSSAALDRLKHPFNTSTFFTTASRVRHSKTALVQHKCCTGVPKAYQHIHPLLPFASG